MTPPPALLIIAGADPTGGAGIGADIRTADRLGVFPLPVVSCIAAQNHLGISAIIDPGAAALRSQLDALILDFRPEAVKIGLLPSSEAVTAVAGFIREHKLTNVVVDPVLSASCGGETDNIDMIRLAMADELFPLATLVTPNIPEHHAFEIDVPDCWKRPHYMLLKGGHALGPDGACDRLLHGSRSEIEETSYTRPKVESRNLHGTGCILSSAIAAGLALGLDLDAAVGNAKDFLWNAIQKSAQMRFESPYGPAMV